MTTSSALTSVEVSEVAAGSNPASIAEVATALAKAQANFGPIPRSRRVTVRTKDSGSYTFNYAPLDEVLAAVRKPLADNGLSITQILTGGNNGGMRLRTVLLHSSGQFIASEVPLVSVGNTPQALGSAITYMRRYVITALLGVASEEDDDGNHASGNQVESSRPAPAKAKEQKDDSAPTAAQLKKFAGIIGVPGLWSQDEKDTYSAAESRITSGREYQAMLDDLIALGTARKNADPGSGA